MSVKLSLDGISESRSTNISLDVCSAKINTCQTVYPLRIIRPLSKLSVNYSDHLKTVLNDLDSNNCTLSQVVADNPKRAFVRNSLSHGARYACEYCFANGIPLRDTKELHNEIALCEQKKETIPNSTNISEKQKKRQLLELNSIHMKLTKSTQIVWPQTTSNGEKRTIEAINGILTELEESRGQFKDIKGVIGPSPLLTFQDFDFIHGIPTEYLHSVCIGLVKRLLELCFNIGDHRSRITTKKLSTTVKFNESMSIIQVPREFSRRCRKLDFSVMKAQELRNILLFFFEIVIDCFSPIAKERKLWLQ